MRRPSPSRRRDGSSPRRGRCCRSRGCCRYRRYSVVAAEAFELVEGAVVADVEGSGGAERAGVVAVGEVGALDGLDRTQRVVADGCVAGGGSRPHVDGDRPGREVDVVVGGEVEAAAAVDVVVAGEAGEGFGACSAVAAEYRVVEHRRLDGID